MTSLTLTEPLAPFALRSFGTRRWSDAEYWAFCEANRNLHIERTPDGEIVIVPPAGGESDYRNNLVAYELT